MPTGSKYTFWAVPYWLVATSPRLTSTRRLWPSRVKTLAEALEASAKSRFCDPCESAGVTAKSRAYSSLERARLALVLFPEVAVTLDALSQKVGLGTGVVCVVLTLVDGNVVDGWLLDPMEDVTPLLATGKLLVAELVAADLDTPEEDENEDDDDPGGTVIITLWVTV